MSTSESKKITLKSSDGEEFVVDEAVASQSQTIKHMMEDLSTDNIPIPLPEVSSKTLSKVIQYCTNHVGFTDDSVDFPEKIKTFDKNFVEELDQPMLHALIVAGNYMDIKPLLNLGCQTVADMIKDKSPEEMRIIFNITNDFTPEEEEKIRQENIWAFE